MGCFPSENGVEIVASSATQRRRRRGLPLASPSPRPPPSADLSPFTSPQQPEETDIEGCEQVGGISLFPSPPPRQAPPLKPLLTSPLRPSGPFISQQQSGTITAAAVGIAAFSEPHLAPSMRAPSRVGFDDDRAPNASTTGAPPFSSSSSPTSPRPADFDMSFGERAVAAAGAAVLSVILVNPLDVAKTRLQAQAAGVPYYPFQPFVHRHIVSLGSNTIFSDIRCSPSCTRGGIFGTEIVCPPDCFQYKGTLDVFHKIIRQEGFARLWRGTNAALALAIPTVGIYLPCYDIFRNWIEDFTTCNAPTLTPYAPLIAGSVARSLACIACSPIELARTRMQAFKEFRSGTKPPGMWRTLVGVLSPLKNTNNLQNLQNYRILWTGVGAQLARDVPFSAICWSTLEPIRRRLLGLVGEETDAASVLGANFAAGFVAGSLAAAATCPLDVAKTRRQIEKDPNRALKMTTRQTLVEVWRDRGMKGLFTGAGPRVGRAGPSVGIVVSFYEVVKYVLHQRHSDFMTGSY